MRERQFDLVIIGAGIIGLATAREAGRRFPRLRLLVLEKEDRVGAHQSSHNSGVIHSGLYYRPGTIKAKTCVEGGAALVAFCREHGIPYEICGKVVVATEEPELPVLEELYRRGTAHRIPGLSLLSPEQLREIEPHSAGIRALRVPGTGITDYGAITEKFAEMVVERGGEVRTGTRVIGLAQHAGGITVETTTGTFATRAVINCAGLHSDRISRMGGAPTNFIIVPFRGEYYQVVPGRRELVKALLYPVPDPKLPFLGVHFTRRLRGGIEAGPNAVLAFKREGYRRTDIDFGDALEALTNLGFWRLAGKYWRVGLGELYRSLSKKAFLGALQKLVPEIRESDLAPGGAGVRAQAVDRDGGLVDDFRFVCSGRMLHVCNVPSPAATACIAIGRRIVDMARDTFGLPGEHRETREGSK